MNLEERFRRYIYENELFRFSDSIFAAVSGGIDSIVMVHLLYNSNIHFAIAHINFKLRGEESNEDEKFVFQLSEKYGVEYYLNKFDTELIADEKNISIQMAARELRYNWFEEIRKKKKFNYIAVAHNADDVLETILLNLLRGTGLKGLTGIQPKTGKVVRPLLFANRSEIKEYCIHQKLKYREDSSNAEVKYKRNMIRNQVFPIFSKINPSYKNSFLHSANYFKKAYSYYKAEMNKDIHKLMSKRGKNIFINIHQLLKKGEDLGVFLFEILHDFNFNTHVIANIESSLSDQSGKLFYSSSHRCIKDRDELVITPLLYVPESPVLLEEDTDEITHPVHMTFSVIENNTKVNITDSEKMAYIDYEKLIFPLVLRKWIKGDRFKPLGMSKFKKLSDYFVDKKYSIPEKENTWIISSEQAIVWIVGKRLDDRYKVTDNTRRILIIQLKN
ncbi:tRNA lysidine(34) synthetase TilS [Bacteroidota bacterium]